MSIKRNRKRLVICIIALIVFILITITVNMGYFDRIDTMVFDFVKQIRVFPLSVFMQSVTQFGGFYLVVTIGIFLIVFLKRKEFPLFLITITGATAALNLFLKNLIDRPRPINILPLVTETSLSYPSGHTVSSLVFYGLISKYVQNNMKNKGLAIFIQILLAILIALIGISRIYLGVHHLSDVLAGISLGIAILMAVLILIDELRVPMKKVVPEENKEYNM